MQLATIWLETNQLHDNARLTNISPAEAVIYRDKFGMRTEDSATPTNPITHLTITEEDSKRTPAEDYARLAKKFGGKEVKKLFPAGESALPKTFKDAGFDETEDDAPKAGKPFKVPPMPKLPDSGADLEPETVNPLEAVVTKQAEQINKLTEMVSQLIAKTQQQPSQVTTTSPTGPKQEATPSEAPKP